MKPAAVVAVVLMLAGCGGGSRQAESPPPPRLPHALAESWNRQANAVAAALAVNDGCAAAEQADRLRTEVIAAINARRVPRPLLEPLTSAVNALPARITCTPPPPPASPAKAPKPPKHGKHGDGHGHGHGKDQGGEGD